ncbi:hypothetical protein BDV3_004742 [Batrachochytrium dendrobatidis]
MVSTLTLSKLNVPNLRTVLCNATGFAPQTDVYCSYHDNCSGHLQSSPSGRISFPSFMVHMDEEIMSEADRLHAAFLGITRTQGTLTPLEFSVALREYFSGRRGILKYRALGMQPMMGCRGVATCHWGSDFRKVFIPRRWMNRINVATVAELTDPNGEHFVSSDYTIRKVVDGDYAILIRCPTLSDQSIQAVQVYAWDEASIGVHPNFCSPLNLDYDGDEVHVVPLVTPLAIVELKQYMSDNAPYTFDTIASESVSHLMTGHITVDRHNAFLLSTRSLGDTQPDVIGTDLHTQMRNKPGPWKNIRNTMTAATVSCEDFRRRSITAIDNLTQSHLCIHEGHTFSRQLKYAMSQISSQNHVVRAKWFHSADGTMQGLRIPPYISLSTGLPGVRLASRIGRNVTQLLLDIAKRAVSSSATTGVLLSLLSNGESYTACIDPRTGSKLVSVTSSIPSNAEILLPMSRTGIALYRGTLASKFRIALVACEYALQCLKIEWEGIELYELAYCVAAASLINESPPITGTRSMQFISRTHSNVLLTGIVDDLKQMDATIREAAPLHFVSSSDDPMIASFIGNFSRINHLSVRHK